MSNIFRKILIYSFFLSLSTIPLFPFSLYMPDDPEVAELVLLYTRAGYVFPDASYPLSLADLYDYASRLENITDRPAILYETEDYKGSLNYEKGRAVINNKYSLNTTAFINGDSYISDENSNLEYTRYPNDFYNRFVEFPDLGSLGLSAGVQGESGLYFSVGLKKEYNPGTIPDSNLFVSTSSDPAKFENYFVRRGYLAWKTDHFELRLGRTPVHYGDALFSTFLPSNKLPWLDTFTYRYKVGPLTMTSYFGTIDSRITDDEDMIFSGGTTGLFSESGNVSFIQDDEGNFNLWIDSDDNGIYDNYATDYSFQNTIILNSMHRFILGWKKLRLGFTSSIVVARENNAIQIGDIFPVFSWHNAVLGSNNMNLVFDAGYTPVAGLALYGQAAWDDINASDIFGIPDSSVPTIGAYLFGVSWMPWWKSELNLTTKMEIGTTHYLWGNYYAYDSWKGSYLSRAIYRYHSQKGYFWMPLTSPYGPGTWWLEGKADLKTPGNFDFTLGLTYLKFNSDVNLITTPYSYNPDLEEFNSTSFTIYLKSKYTYSLNKSNYLQFSITPGWYSYKGHMWPEVEISLELSGKKVKDFK